MQPEARMKTAIIAELRKRGYYAQRMGAGPFMRVGTPDIILHLKSPAGRACYLEAKLTGEKSTRVQSAVQQEIIASGALAFEVHSVVEALAVVAASEGLP